MANSIIESIRTYILTCPFLSDGKMNVDYLGTTATEYSIDPLPSKRVVTQYTDGGSLRQFQFAFTSREYYGSDVMQNIDNSGFYEDFSDWMEEQSKSRVFPALSDTKQTAQKLETLTSGYLFDSDAETARYQIQCRLIYKQER